LKAMKKDEKQRTQAIPLPEIEPDCQSGDQDCHYLQDRHQWAVNQEEKNHSQDGTQNHGADIDEVRLVFILLRFELLLQIAIFHVENLWPSRIDPGLNVPARSF